MQFTESSSDEQILPPSKNPVGRPRTAEWRRTEDGKYNSNPLSETYFNNYYIENLKMFILSARIVRQ